jgi:hypothetical protein
MVKTRSKTQRRRQRINTAAVTTTNSTSPKPSAANNSSSNNGQTKKRTKSRSRKKATTGSTISTSITTSKTASSTITTIINNICCGKQLCKIFESKIIKSMLTFIICFLIIITGHFVLIHFYVNHCVPTWWKSVVNVGSPICQFVNRIQYELGLQYIYLWGAAAASIAAWTLHQLGCCGTVSNSNTIVLKDQENKRDENFDGPTFEVIDANDTDSDDNQEQALVLDNPNDALVHQIAQSKMAHPNLNVSSQLQKHITENNDSDDEDDGDDDENDDNDRRQ